MRGNAAGCCRAELVHSAQETVNVNVVWLRGLRNRLVVDGEVVEHVRVGVRPAVHSVETGLHDVANLERKRRVVRHDGVIRRRDEVRVSVCVLKTFASERRFASGRSNDEAARHLVSRQPHLIACSLETKHRIQHINRNHRLALRCIGGTGCDERGHRASFVDSRVNDLPRDALLVGEQQFTVDGGVVLTGRVVDLRRREVRVHSKSSCLIRNDRDEPRAPVFIAQEVLEQAGERHRGGDFLFAATLLSKLKVLVVNRGKRCELGSTLGERTTQFGTTLQQILNRGVVRPGVVVGRTVRVRFELFVRDRDSKIVTERLENVERELLHLVNSVTTLERFSETVTLDCFCKDDRRLSLVSCRLRVCRVQLAVIVTTSLQCPNLLV